MAVSVHFANIIYTPFIITSYPKTGYLMATIKQRLLKKNSSGTYDTIHLETSVDCLTGILPIEKGGTGASTLTAVQTALAIGSSNILSGTVKGTDKTMTVTLNAYPKVLFYIQKPIYSSLAVFVVSTRTIAGTYSMYNTGSGVSTTCTVSITSTGFTVSGYQLVRSDYTYIYIAFL